MLESIKTETQTQGIVGMESWRPVQPALPAGPGERSDPRRAAGVDHDSPVQSYFGALAPQLVVLESGLTARG